MCCLWMQFITHHLFMWHRRGTCISCWTRGESSDRYWFDDWLHYNHALVTHGHCNTMFCITMMQPWTIYCGQNSYGQASVSKYRHLDLVHGRRGSQQPQRLSRSHESGSHSTRLRFIGNTSHSYARGDGGLYPFHSMQPISS